MIRQVHRVAEDHPGACDGPRIPAKDDSHSAILGWAGSLHRAKVVAEEVIIVCDVLSDVSDAQLCRRPLVRFIRTPVGMTKDSYGARGLRVSQSVRL